MFYNGEDDIPDEMELKLSDAFKGGKGDLELIVHVYNINEGHDPELFQKCPKLDEYTKFIGTVRRCRKNGQSYKEAIEECIQNGILKEYLEINGSEVVIMLIATYDYETDIRVQREEAAEEAAEKALQEGLKEGLKEGKLLSLFKFLSNGGSEKDAMRLLDASEEEIAEAKKMKK